MLCSKQLLSKEITCINLYDDLGTLNIYESYTICNWFNINDN